MEIREISVGDLPRYFKAETYDAMDVIPVTPSRARSMYRNPCAKPDDVAFWTAHDDKGRLIGFIGNLPGFDSGRHSRIGWNSCWWVDPARGKHAAMSLFTRYLKHWDLHVAFSDMTPRTFAIVKQLDFCHTRQEQLLQLHVRLGVGQVLEKVGKAGLLWNVLAGAAIFPVNLVQYIRLWVGTRMGPFPELECCDRLDAGMWAYVRRHQMNDLFPREREEFEWIGSHSWLVERNEASEQLAKKFPFSYLTRGSRFQWMVTRRNRSITSACAILLREGILKVHYFYGTEGMDALLALRLHAFREKQICSIILAHPQLTTRSGVLRRIGFHTRKRIRYTGVSKKVRKEFPEERVLQMGDGDAVFT